MLYRNDFQIILKTAILGLQIRRPEAQIKKPASARKSLGMTLLVIWVALEHPESSSGRWLSCFCPTSAETDYCLSIIFASRKDSAETSVCEWWPTFHFKPSSCTWALRATCPSFHSSLAGSFPHSLNDYFEFSPPQFPSHPLSLRDNDFIDCLTEM